MRFATVDENATHRTTAAKITKISNKKGIFETIQMIMSNRVILPPYISGILPKN